MKDYSDIFSPAKPLIVPRPKRDHKKQKRLQCAVPFSRQYDFLGQYAMQGIPILNVCTMSQDDWNSLHDELVSVLY